MIPPTPPFSHGSYGITEKWTPLIGQRGSVFKVESDIFIMLPLRAVQCPQKPHSVSDRSDWSEAARDYNGIEDTHHLRAFFDVKRLYSGCLIKIELSGEGQGHAPVRFCFRCLFDLRYRR